MELGIRECRIEDDALRREERGNVLLSGAVEVFPTAAGSGGLLGESLQMYCRSDMEEVLKRVVLRARAAAVDAQVSGRIVNSRAARRNSLL